MEDNRRWSMMNGVDVIATSASVPSKRPVMQPLTSKMLVKNEAVNGDKKAVNLWQNLQDERERRQEAETQLAQAQKQLSELRRELEERRNDDDAVEKDHELQSRLDDMTRQLSASSEIVSVAVDKLQAEINDQASLISNQTEELAKKEDFIATLKLEQSEVNLLNEKSRGDEVKSLKGVLAEMESKLLDKEVELAEQESRLGAECKRLEEQLVEVLKGEEKVESILSDNSVHISILEGESAVQKEMIESFEAKIAEYEDNLLLSEGLSELNRGLQLKLDEVLLENKQLRCKELVKRDEDIERMNETIREYELERGKRPSLVDASTESIMDMSKNTDVEVQCEDPVVDPILQRQLDEYAAEVRRKNHHLHTLAQQIEAKDLELEQKNMHFQFIEEKVNEFDVRLTYQTQELETKMAVIGELEERNAELESENFRLNKLVGEVVDNVKERDVKIHLVDMLEEELKEKNILLEAKDRDLMEIKELFETLKDDSSRVELEAMKTKLLESEQQVETLRSYCQYQVKQHEDQLMLQCNLEDRLQEKLLRLEENRVQTEALEHELESLAGVREELDEKKLLLMSKDVQLEKLGVAVAEIERMEVAAKKMEEDWAKMQADLACKGETIKELQSAYENKSSQVQHLEEELQRNNTLTLNLTTRIEMLEVKHTLELEKSVRTREEEELATRTEMMLDQSRLEAVVEEVTSNLRDALAQVAERDQQLVEIRTLLEAQMQEKYELNQKLEFQKQALEDQGKQDEALQRQDKYIQRLQLQNAELERDMQLCQQDALRQQQDCYDEFTKEKEVLQQQLQKQSLLLQEQDLRLHQQQEQLTAMKPKSKFLGWKRK